MLTTTLVYSFSTVGQVLCPIPVLGALVGGVARQLAAATLVNGIRLALAAGRLAEIDEARFEQLEAEVLIALEMEEALREAVRALAAEFDAAMAETVYPALSAVEASLDGTDGDDALRPLADLSRVFGGSPLFRTQAEFDDWMLDDGPLFLNPNMGS